MSEMIIGRSADSIVDISGGRAGFAQYIAPGGRFGARGSNRSLPARA
jgi:hypothetical protein